MKQLLLITAITCAFSVTAFAGSSCKPCPTAPAQEKKDAPADAQKDQATEQQPMLLLAGGSAPKQADDMQKSKDEMKKDGEEADKTAAPQLLA